MQGAVRRQWSSIAKRRNAADGRPEASSEGPRLRGTDSVGMPATAPWYACIPLRGRTLLRKALLSPARPHPGLNPKGRMPAGALLRCGWLVENGYTSPPAPCTASRR